MTGSPETVQLPVPSRPRRVEGRRGRWVRGLFEIEAGLLIVPDLDALLS